MVSAMTRAPRALAGHAREGGGPAGRSRPTPRAGGEARWPRQRGLRRRPWSERAWLALRALGPEHVAHVGHALGGRLDFSEPRRAVLEARIGHVARPGLHVVRPRDPPREIGDLRRVREVGHDSHFLEALRALAVEERLEGGGMRTMRQSHRVDGDHAFGEDTAPAEELTGVIAERLTIIQVLVEEGYPESFLLGGAHGKDADVAAGQDEHGMP